MDTTYAMKLYLTVFIIFLLMSCKDTPPLPAEELPNTPEEVVLKYQQYLDRNEFESAKWLSTPKEKERLDMIADIMEQEPQDSTLMVTKFIDLNCREVGDRATCVYLIEIEEGEQLKDSFALRRIDGQWLVDVTEEIIYMEGDTF